MLGSTRTLALAALAVITSPLATHAQITCGPVILAGHDADDHGFELIYAGLFDALLTNMSNGGSGILAIGADGGSKAGDWIVSVASQMTTPPSVTFVNDGPISTVSFDGYAILHIPSDGSDTPGGITQAESDFLNTRRDDLADFITSGGAVFGLTQGQLIGGWDWLDGVGGVTHMDAPPSGTLPSGGSFHDVATTADGNLLGITDTNLDGCCFHNVFTSYPSFLEVLAYADEPADPDWHGEAVFMGGLSICVNLNLEVEFDWIRADQSGADVAVRWMTLSEEDTLGFLLYRSPSEDGAGATVVGEVVAQGAHREYTLVDPAPGGPAWYWVEEVSTSGSGDRSPVVRVGQTARSSARHRGDSVRR